MSHIPSFVDSEIVGAQLVDSELVDSSLRDPMLFNSTRSSRLVGTSRRSQYEQKYHPRSDCSEKVERLRIASPDVVLRTALTEHLECLFGRLRGQALLLATLAYGLGVRLSQLRDVKVRDVSIVDETISLAGRDRAIPAVLLEDLREHVHDRVCGFEASTTGSRRDHRLFSDEAFDALAAESRRVDSLFSEKFRSPEGRRARVCLDSRLRILGWFHRKRAALRGIVCSSGLELFDKGPRIVRRGRAGAVDAYYVWRASRVLFS